MNRQPLNTRTRASSNLLENNAKQQAFGGRPLAAKAARLGNGRTFGQTLPTNVLAGKKTEIDNDKLTKGVNNLKVTDENATLLQAGKGKPTIKPVTKLPPFLQPKPPVLEQKPSFSSHILPAHIEDIDKDDGGNVLLATDYVKDIYSYLRKLEVSQPIRNNFLSVQREMTPKMRTVLVDWLINVHHQFKLLPETLYMGVALMDRFFQREAVSKDKIQLVGVTAFFIASKFEEIYPPDLMDFVVICDQLYTKKEILKMEITMLRVLNFELARPLPLHFLRRDSKAAHVDPQMHSMAKYLMELLLLDHEAAAWSPSLMAATALYVTLKIFTNQSITWNDSIAFYSGYNEEQLLSHAVHLCKHIRRNEQSRFENCRKKYATSKNLFISKSPQLNSEIIDELAAKEV